MWWKNRNVPKPSVPQDNVVSALPDSTVFAISVNKNSAFLANDGSAESMQNYLDSNARETASNEARELFRFEHGGRQIFPVFTSSELLDDWLKQTPLTGGFTAVTVFTFEGRKLFRRFAGMPVSVIVVLNPMSAAERFLSYEELQSLAQA